MITKRFLTTLLFSLTATSVIGGSAALGQQAEGTDPFANAPKSHFAYQKTEDASWYEPAVDEKALLDGTEKSFSYNQLASIYTDVDPGIQIELALKNMPRKTTKEARDYLLAKSKAIISERAAVTGEHRCPESEALMCFVMARGIELAEIIDALSVDTLSPDHKPGHRQPGILDQEVRVLATALNMARNNYRSLIEFATNKTHKANDVFNPPYRKFGKEFADTFMAINESVLSARAQYAVAFTVLGYFQYDLIRKRTAGEDNANLRASRAAASVINEALGAPGMITPDRDPELMRPFQRLKAIRSLWEAFYQASDILYKYAPETAAIGDLSINSPEELNAAAAGQFNKRTRNAAFAPDERLFLADTLQEVWVKHDEPGSDWVTVAIHKDSSDLSLYTRHRSADLIRTISANGEFHEGDRVVDLADLSSVGTVKATLENGQIIVNWENPDHATGMSTNQLARYLSAGDGTFAPKMAVWRKSSNEKGTVLRVYSKQRIVVDFGTDGIWRGSEEDLTLHH